MVDIGDPRRPEAQAFLRYAWNGVLVDAGEVLAAAGPFGIQELGLNESNLLRSDEPAVVVRKKKHKK